MITNEMITLEPTAAMALLLGQGIYRDNQHIAQYLQRIDLSSGIPLAERLKSIMKHTRELTENRKYFYHNYILNHVRSNQHNSQVVILGVGYDPISVHLLDEEADNIDFIVEIDMSSFDAKKALFGEINVPHMEKIKFVQANAVTSHTLDLIRPFGYDAEKPAVITMEGLMYYLSQEELVRLIKSFESPNKINSFCIDYVFPSTEAPEGELRMQHKLAEEAVERQANMKCTYYTAGQIVDLVKSLGGTSVEVSTQKDIEYMRTGGNNCFTQKGAGIFEFITFNI